MFVNITRSCHFLGSRTHGDGECALRNPASSYASRQSREASQDVRKVAALSLLASCPARPARPAQTGLIPVLFYLWRSVADVMVCEISCALPILEAELRKARGGGGPGVNLWREQKIIIDGRNCDSKKSIHNSTHRSHSDCPTPRPLQGQRQRSEEEERRGSLGGRKRGGGGGQLGSRRARDVARSLFAHSHSSLSLPPTSHCNISRTVGQT